MFDCPTDLKFEIGNHTARAQSKPLPGYTMNCKSKEKPEALNSISRQE
jgi:hypothetical protein